MSETSSSQTGILGPSGSTRWIMRPGVFLGVFFKEIPFRKSQGEDPKL